LLNFVKSIHSLSKINKVLINFGIININNEPDICLLDYLSDSLQLMEFLCEIEEELGIELDDDIISYEIFYSLNGFCELLESMINKKEGGE